MVKESRIRQKAFAYGRRRIIRFTVAHQHHHQGVQKFKLAGPIIHDNQQIFFFRIHFDMFTLTFFSVPQVTKMRFTTHLFFFNLLLSNVYSCRRLNLCYTLWQKANFCHSYSANQIFGILRYFASSFCLAFYFLKIKYQLICICCSLIDALTSLIHSSNSFFLRFHSV